LEIGAGGLVGVTHLVDDNGFVYKDKWHGGARLGPTFVLPTARDVPHAARFAMLPGVAGSYDPTP